MHGEHGGDAYGDGGHGDHGYVDEGYADEGYYDGGYDEHTDEGVDPDGINFLDDTDKEHLQNFKNISEDLKRVE